MAQKRRQVPPSSGSVVLNGPPPVDLPWIYETLFPWQMLGDSTTFWAFDGLLLKVEKLTIHREEYSSGSRIAPH
jgi:hypothetical protein